MSSRKRDWFIGYPTIASAKASGTRHVAGQAGSSPPQAEACPTNRGATGPGLRRLLYARVMYTMTPRWGLLCLSIIALLLAITHRPTPPHTRPQNPFPAYHPF